MVRKLLLLLLLLPLLGRAVVERQQQQQQRRCSRRGTGSGDISSGRSGARLSRRDVREIKEKLAAVLRARREAAANEEPLTAAKAAAAVTVTAKAAGSTSQAELFGTASAAQVLAALMKMPPLAKALAAKVE